ncbi:hypothetical protein H5410_049552 [Solanum commersonii]|uniref:Uncharacterized protein n=1 Tax=Solanum commersonii TaxID=4109 RepID=A0A9J5WUH8_SOLCO|nr:hypothetical protein H5410_049552 [Solanum commersonii]
MGKKHYSYSAPPHRRKKAFKLSTEENFIWSTHAPSLNPPFYNSLLFCAVCVFDATVFEFLDEKSEEGGERSFALLGFTVAANPVSNRPEDHLLANQISSVGINQELAEELWLNCRLELVHSNEAVEDLEFSYPGEEANGIFTNRRSLTKNKEKNANLLTKEALMGCLVKKNLLFLISGEEKHSPTWYTRCMDFLFSWYGAPRRRELLQVGDAPAPAPATSSSETPNSPPPARPPTTPFFPRDYNDSSKTSGPSDQSSTSQNSTSDGQSNKKKSSTKTVLVAVLVTAAVTFIVVALFFICYCKVCGVGYRKGKNDERPLLSLSISDYSVGTSLFLVSLLYIY